MLEITLVTSIVVAFVLGKYTSELKAKNKMKNRVIAVLGFVGYHLAFATVDIEPHNQSENYD